MSPLFETAPEAPRIRKVTSQAGLLAHGSAAHPPSRALRPVACWMRLTAHSCGGSYGLGTGPAPYSLFIHASKDAETFDRSVVTIRPYSVNRAAAALSDWRTWTRLPCRFSVSPVIRGSSVRQAMRKNCAPRAETGCSATATAPIAQIAISRPSHFRNRPAATSPDCGETASFLLNWQRKSRTNRTRDARQSTAGAFGTF